jgi:hypothetical protein
MSVFPSLLQIMILRSSFDHQFFICLPGQQMRNWWSKKGNKCFLPEKNFFLPEKSFFLPDKFFSF